MPVGPLIGYYDAINSAIRLSIVGGGGTGGGGGATGYVSAGDSAMSLGTLSFADSNGLSWGLSEGALTASYTVPTQSDVALSGSNGSFTFQTASFGNANGLSFYTSNGSVIGSYTVPTLTNSSWTVSDGAGSGSVGRLAFTNLNGVTLSLSTGAGGSHTIVGSHNGLTSQSGQALSGSNGSFAFQTATFGNLNGMSFYSSNGSMVGSYTVPSVTNSSLTFSDAATSLTAARLAFTNANGLTLSLSTTTGGSATLVGSYTVPTVTNSSLSVSDAATSGTVGRLAFTNLNGVTLSLSTGAGGSHTVVGSHNGLTSQSGQALSGSNGSFAFQTATLGNLNGLSFYTSNGSLVGSYTVPNVPAQTNQTLGLYALGNTTQNSSSTFDARTLSFNGLGGVTVGYSNGSIQISGPQTAAQTNQTVGLFGLGNTTQNSSTTLDARSLSFNGLGGVTVGYSNGSIQLSGAQTAAQTNQTIGLYGVGNTTQNSSTTLDARTLSFAGRGDVTVGYSNGTVQISGSQSNQVLSMFAQSNTTQSSSGTQNASSLMFAGAGVASVGITNGSVLISVPAGGGAGDGGVFAGVSNLGNTAGSTGTVSTGNYVLVGSQGITLSQSTAAAGSAGTVTILGPGAQVTKSKFNPYMEAAGILGQAGQGILHIHPVPDPSYFQYDRVLFDVLFSNATNSTGSVTISMWAGLYTRNASTLSLYGSASTSLGLTFSGNVNNSLLSGPRIMSMGWTSTITANDYWFGVVSRTTSGGANASISQYVQSDQASNFSGILGVSSAGTNQNVLGLGYYANSTSGMPSAIAFSEINGTNGAVEKVPLYYFLSQTA